MDNNSQFFGEGEECNSSESGWTMYIGSPSIGDGELENIGDFDEIEESNYNREGRVNEDDEDEDGDTDDSMASDASSGPISYFSRNGKSGGVGVVNFKKSKEKGKEKDCSISNSKAKSSMKNGYKNDDQDNKMKESIFAAAKGTKGAFNGGGNKARKSIWMGKGK